MSEETQTADGTAAAVAAAMEKIKSNKPAANTPKAQVQSPVEPPPVEPEATPQHEEFKIPLLEPSFNGRSRDTFCIYGSGFGEVRGYVTLGGFQARLTSWQDHCIKGITPEMLTDGTTELTINGSAPVTVRLSR